MEEPLPAYSSCNLGSVNYSTLVKNPFTNPEFQQEKYEQSIKLMVILLNKIIDINYYPLEEQKEVAHNKRPVGLGFTGLADSLCMMKIKYSSNEGKEFTEELLKTLRDVSYRTSIEITKGLNKTFTGFDPKFIESTFCRRLPEDIRNDIVKHGIYNSRLLTTAPSGCLDGSTEIQTSLGILSLKEIFKLNDIDYLNYEEQKLQNIWIEPIEDIYANTSEGPKKITKLYFNGKSPTKRIYDNKGNLLIEGTYNHKIVVLRNEKEIWIRLDEIIEGDIIKKY